MADYPMTLETWPTQPEHVADDFAGVVLETWPAQPAHSDWGGFGIDMPDIDLILPYGFKLCRREGQGKFTINKIWDPGGGGNWVLWESTEPDVDGWRYPDPYGSGFSACTGFRTAGFPRYR